MAKLGSAATARVVLQRIDRIVGGAQRQHVAVGDQPAGGEPVAAHRRGALPDFGGGVGAEQEIVDTEIAGELQVAPVVQRIAQQVGEDAGEGVEFLAVAGVAGAEAFGHAVGAHLAPLVVITVEPHLADVLPADIGGDLGRRQVSVEIDDRQVGRVVEVEAGGLVALEQKALVDETAHRSTPALPPRTRCSTSASDAIVVSPGVVIARAPCAAPYSTASAASPSSRSP